MKVELRWMGIVGEVEVDQVDQDEAKALGVSPQQYAEMIWEAKVLDIVAREGGAAGLSIPTWMQATFQRKIHHCNDRFDPFAYVRQAMRPIGDLILELRKQGNDVWIAQDGYLEFSNYGGNVDVISKRESEALEWLQAEP